MALYVINNHFFLNKQCKFVMFTFNLNLIVLCVCFRSSIYNQQESYDKTTYPSLRRIFAICGFSAISFVFFNYDMENVGGVVRYYIIKFANRYMLVDQRLLGDFGHGRFIYHSSTFSVFCEAILNEGECTVLYYFQRDRHSFFVYGIYRHTN